MEAYIDAWKQIFDLKSSMNKDEYWGLMIIHIVFGILTPLPVFLFGTFRFYVIIVAIYYGIHFLPILSMSIKRLNDVKRSKLWLLLLFIPLVGWYILIMLLMELSKEDANYAMSDEEYGNLINSSEQLKAQALIQEQAARNNMRR